jgi:iron-sulfur cluster repair protein YtfE (RIC family)
MSTTTTHPSTVMGYLSTDHRRLDGIMEECSALAQKGDMAAAAKRFAMFHEGLARHIRIEEELLFPEFEKATGLSEGGPTGVMRHEHLEIRRLMASLGELFSAPAPTAAEFEAIRSALYALLHEHNVKEERILYPMTDRLVPPKQRDDLVAKMQRY